MGSHESSQLPRLRQVAPLKASGLEGTSGVRPLEGPGEHLVEGIDKRQQLRGVGSLWCARYAAFSASVVSGNFS